MSTNNREPRLKELTELASKGGLRWGWDVNGWHLATILRFGDAVLARLHQLAEKDAMGARLCYLDGHPTQKAPGGFKKADNTIDVEGYKLWRISRNLVKAPSITEGISRERQQRPLLALCFLDNVFQDIASIDALFAVLSDTVQEFGGFLPLRIKSEWLDIPIMRHSPRDGAGESGWATSPSEGYAYFTASNRLEEEPANDEEDTPDSHATNPPPPCGLLRRFAADKPTSKRRSRTARGFGVKKRFSRLASPPSPRHILEP
ncbi:hypothetical protein HDU89_001970 [Geranomyces variabilis]|nr:hypothetical protein HDU89_001970 [Geranomyces variabilis]